MKGAAKKTSTVDTPEMPALQHTKRQLEDFLDSVGHLPTGPLANKAAFYADSVFTHQQQMDTLISIKDLNTLKKAIRKGAINVKSAVRIFKNPKIDASCTEKSINLTYKPGLTPIEFYPFSKNKNGFDEYGICIGDPDHCENACLYFFKGNKVIAMHIFYERFAPGLHHYKDSDGKTVIYYEFDFNEGTGNWWFNYFFYKYDNDKLIPVLNELANGNSQGGYNTRVLWLKSSIQKTRPLSIKMVYYDQFTSPMTDSPYVYGPRFLDDSTIVKYSWDGRKKKLVGNYDQTKIKKAQILTYYGGNELLFINAYYETLKASLHDKEKRKGTLGYLDLVMNQGLK